MEAPIEYLPGFIKSPDEVFTALRDAPSWLRHDTSNRCEYYCNDFPFPYTYGSGRGRRSYEVQPYIPAILGVRKALESHTGTIFEVCFLNRYLNQSDSLGWHADDSPEMDPARPIAVVSFGVEREIWFKPNEDQTAIQKLKLGHGSLCVMQAGMQQTWKHRIPKASFQCGERISMTFRGYVRA